MSRTWKALTTKQKEFCRLYATKGLDTFGNAVRAYIAAGYKNTPNAMSSSCVLLQNPKIKQELRKYEEDIKKKQAITEEYVRQEWINLLNDCKDESGKYQDRTNANTVLGNMAKSLAMLTDRVIDKTETIHLEEHERREAKKIASILVNSHFLDDTHLTPLPQPIDTELIPIREDNGTQEEE